MVNKIQELESMLERERNSRSSLDEELMKTKQERNIFMEQVEQMWDSREKEDKEKVWSNKSIWGLYKQLNEYEDQMRTTWEDNKRLAWELDKLRKGDDHWKTLQEMQVSILSFVIEHTS